VDTTAPCKGQGPNRRLDRTRPHIRLGGVPSRRRCAHASFPARVRVSDRSGLRRIAVYLNGRLIRDTRKPRFRVRVRTRPGRHRFTVLARDGAGNRARLSRVFRRCAG